MPSLLEWLIENKKAPLLAAAVGLLLAVPALWAGLVADDFVHRAILLGDGLYGVPVEPTMDLFSFIKDGAIRDQAARIGLIAWWTDPQTRIALWRPLAALTHVAGSTGLGQLPGLRRSCLR
ncbi:MAG: hypothetical protein HYV63_18195 [Candidatus Schekmanbacteria bacterium]|nr:hypothetical protein [Candidatus Schekmanbacteria bacterium]